MRWIAGLVSIALLGTLSWAVVRQLQTQQSQAVRQNQSLVAPVSVAPVVQSRIAMQRVYSGTLEARARFVVAPKVGGRIVKLTVDLADPVQQGQVVAQLDDAEFVQSVEQAKADLAVAEANIAEATNANIIAERELQRILTLRERGVASDSQLDTVKANQLAKSAAVMVAKAQAQRARSSLASANIRLGYTRVTASWSGADMQRVVAERNVDAGETVTANTPLMTIVDLHPIIGVIFATEKDYAGLVVGQKVSLSTDTYPDRAFEGHIHRIAPVFDALSRQARIELTIDNQDHVLKPGMFIRAQITLKVEESATIVPADALTLRDGVDGVFLLNEKEQTVFWCPVQIGIRNGDQVQVKGEGIQGQVVTLGQQLIEDGAKVTIPENIPNPASGARG